MKTVLVPDPSRKESKVQWPTFLPDGQRFIYLARRLDGFGQLRIGRLDGSSHAVLESVTNGLWVDPGFLMFQREGVLLAQRVDPSSETLVGDPFSIGEPVDYHYVTGRAQFSASSNGVVAYHSHSELTRLAWFDRSGREIGTLGAPGAYQNIRISPSGGQVLFDRAEPRSGAWDLWITDLSRGVETRVTSDRGAEVTGVWLPDESGMVFGSGQGGAPRLRRKQFASSTDEALAAVAGQHQQSNDISPDGRTLIFVERTINGEFDAFTLPLGGGPPVPFITSTFSKIDFRYAPDGRAVSFVATDTGRGEVYVRSLAGGQQVTVSGGGGLWARWSRDGRELFCLTYDGRVMAVPVRTTPSIQVGAPVTLFTLPPQSNWSDFDVSVDGKRFLAVVRLANPAALPLTVVSNWPSLMSR
jgi:hypothetical protein